MARIFKDSSVLNQFGSPSLNSNTLANRPAFGQVGRLFVDTTNNVIYRDTGTSWVLIGGSGSTPNLQAVTGVGNTSSNGIFLGASGSLTSGLIFEVSGYTRMQQTVGSEPILGASNIKQFIFVADGNASTVLSGNPSPDLNQLFIDIQYETAVEGAGNLQIGAGLFENVLKGTDNLLFTINQTVGISALSPIISYQRYVDTGDSTITHTAGLVINGLQRTGSGILSVTNNYQLLINSSQQFASTSNVTNRWGIYQAGANDNNYFAGQSLFNRRVDFNDIIVVANTVYASGNITNFIAGNTADLIFYSNGFTNVIGTFFSNSTGNFRIGTGADSGRKLQVNGNIEVITTTATGVHTPTAQHLPIYVNGTLYYLQLLN
jgi:hypothetical protein